MLRVTVRQRNVIKCEPRRDLKLHHRKVETQDVSTDSHGNAREKETRGKIQEDIEAVAGRIAKQSSTRSKTTTLKSIVDEGIIWSYREDYIRIARNWDERDERSEERSEDDFVPV